MGPQHILQMEEEDAAADMTADMAALGLPSSFIARLDPTPSTKKKKKSKSKPPSSSSASPLNPDSGAELAELGQTDERLRPTVFHIRSVRLYTPAIYPGFEAQQDASVIDSDLVGQLPISCSDTSEHAEADVLDGLEESCVAGNEGAVRGWEAVWDEQYQCYYFCNSHTLESTWNPPPGFECYAATSSLLVGEQSIDSSVAAQENSAGVVCEEVNRGGDRGLVEQQLGGGDDDDEEESRMSSLGRMGAVAKPNEELEKVCKEEAADLKDKGSSLRGIPFLPGITNSHIRFRDSDDSNNCRSDDGADGGVDWSEIRDETSIQLITEVTFEQENDGFEAFEPSSQHHISSIHSEVRQHVRASEMAMKKRRLKTPSGVDRMDGIQVAGMDETMSKKLIKYWIQRYSLFTRFDEGVKLDEEGWFSVTPEIIAEHQASRFSTAGLVIDAFSGVGGNAIQFALKNQQVIAIDIDPIRVEYARHNAEIYGVADKIEFIVGDFFQLAPSLKADLVFLSPPWGGPEYAKQEIYNLHTMLKPADGCTLFKVAQSIAPSIALFVPRNVDLNQLQELSWLTSPPLPCEVEENYVNDKLKAITAYYGEIAV